MLVVEEEVAEIDGNKLSRVAAMVGGRRDCRRQFGASRVDSLRGEGEGEATVRFPHFELDGEVLDDDGVLGNRRLWWSSGERKKRGRGGGEGAGGRVRGERGERAALRWRSYPLGRSTAARGDRAGAAATS